MAFDPLPPSAQADFMVGPDLADRARDAAATLRAKEFAAVGDGFYTVVFDAAYVDDLVSLFRSLASYVEAREGT